MTHILTQYDNVMVEPPDPWIKRLMLLLQDTNTVQVTLAHFYNTVNIINISTQNAV